MKKYVYILLLLASVSTLATAQIKIGNYTFKDGGEYTGELNQTVKEKQSTRTEIPTKGNI